MGMAKYKSPSHSHKALQPQYQSLLFLLESCTSINKALQIQSQLFVSGLHWQRLFISKLISFFSLSSLPHSLLIFSHLRCPNAFIYNTLIRAHSRSPDPSASLTLYKSLLSSTRTRPNNYTFSFLLRSCTRLSDPDPGLQVHCHVKKFGLDLDVHVKNSLIAFYCRLGDLAIARYLFDEITQREKNPVSFNIMMRGYVKCGRAGDGVQIFKDMVGSGVDPDRRTFVCLMSICKVLGDLRSGKAVHVLALRKVGFDVDDATGERLKLGLVDMYAKLRAMGIAERVFGVMGDGKSVAAWSCMVSGYAKCGEVEIARRLFDQMPEKDLVSWTSMISGYSQNGRYKEALELYEEMGKEGVKPDEVTLVAVLSACAHLHKLDLGRRLHLYVEINNFLSRNNNMLCTAIVDMYAKCGCIETALEIFDRVDTKSKTNSLFNSMISGLAQHGHGERAIAVLGEMEALGLSPDEVTFVGVLCACSHSGMTEEGKEIFELMVNKYGIHPQIEHYGCMVDLLGQGGYLDEAYEFIKNMPISPNSVIWSALLHNCRVHKNAKIGKIAERKLLQLGSTDSKPKRRNFRLADMFSDVTNPEKAKKARKKPVSKQRGWSYIKWHGSLYHFLENDTSHPQSKEIYVMLEEMTGRLKLASHDSELLLDVDKEKRGNAISHHSERIALAFGLINSQPGDTITITMDLRMCWDCHLSFEFLSKIFSRIIVVRDKIRVHRMKNGSCSCGIVHRLPCFSAHKGHGVPSHCMCLDLKISQETDVRY